MQRIGFYLFYIFIWPFTLLPVRIQYWCSNLLYLVIFYFVRYRRKVVIQNLKNSFPEFSQENIKHIEKVYYRHMCDSLIETFMLIHFSNKDILKRFKFKNPEIIQQYYRQNRNVAAVFGHYGNWEWLCSLSLVTSYKVLALYRPLNNPFFDRLMIKFRSKYGVQAVHANRVLKEILIHQNQKVPTMTLFLGDQRPARKYIQYWTKFLNQDTPVFLGVEKISMKLDHVVVFIKIQKIKRGYYEVEFIPLFEKPVETKPYEITEKHLSVLEEIIREKPEYWLWSHRRWKHKKPLQKI